MAAQTIYNEIDLSDKSWEIVNLSAKHTFYLIAVAQNDEVKSITFEISIDSGVANNPLVIQNITLPVTEGISGQRWSGFPDEFNIRPVQVMLKNLDIKKENIDNQPYQVEVNISPLDLG